MTSETLDPDFCYRVIQAKDARYDGRFFICVVSTGIYCRPVCPARVPKKSNCRFVASAAAAEAAGFRSCLRCRPESAPGTPAWTGTQASVARALRLIEDGALDDCDVETLAGRVGLGGRQLRRLFIAHVGATPFDLIDDCRSKGLLVQAYSPVAHGAALHDTALLEMAARYGVGVAQLCIRYCLQLGLQPLPKTANPAHLRSNASLDFMISEADMATLKGADGTDYGEASAFPVFGKKRRSSPVAGG